jgi:ABC-type polysaccharide/polyol phosphate export permease
MGARPQDDLGRTCVLNGIVEDFLRLVDINAKNIHRTYAMAQVTLTKRYSGSALGSAWSVVKPIIFVFAYWFAMTIGIRASRPINGIPYILWLVPGIMPWFYISDAMTVGGSAIRSNSHFVTKMVYPVATLPVSEVLSLYFVHLVMMSLTVAVFVVSGYGLNIYFLQLPYYLLCGLVFTTVMAVLLSALTAMSQDVKEAVRSTMTLLFWLSPVLWSADKISSPVIRTIVLMNPIAYITAGYRNTFVNQRWFFEDLQYSIYFWALMTVMALLASYVFTKLEPEFADVL